MRLKICSKENIEIYAVDRKLLLGKKKKRCFFFLKQRKQTEALGKNILNTVSLSDSKEERVKIWGEGVKRGRRKKRVQGAVPGMPRQQLNSDTQKQGQCQPTSA